MKIGFLAGVAVGYVLGARAGHQRYEQIKGMAGQLWGSQPVQAGIDQAGQTVKTKAVPYVAEKVGDAVKAAGQTVKEKTGNEPVSATVRKDTEGASYADVTTATPVPEAQVPYGRTVPPQEGDSPYRSSAGD
jgi:oxygen-dependent protoporphyrinogen oxidase